MAKTPPFAVRLEPAHRETYRALAASANQSLSDYVREAMSREASRRVKANLTDPHTAQRVRQLLMEGVTPV